MSRTPVVAYPDERLRMVVNRMAATGFTHFPVVKQTGSPELVGLIGLQDLLKARELSVADEQHRERVLRLRVPPSLRWRAPAEKKGTSEKERTLQREMNRIPNYSFTPNSSAISWYLNPSPGM